MQKGRDLEGSQTAVRNTGTRKHHGHENNQGRKRKHTIEPGLIRSAQSRSISGADINQASDKSFTEESLVENTDEKTLTAFSSTLRSILHRNRAEISRIAREMEVAENTIYRWMNGTSEPRHSYLRNLPDIMPEHRQAIIQAINKTFPNVLDMTILARVPEIRIEVYRRVHELIATTADPRNCLWQVAQTVFDYAILHLDTEHKGISIAYASLMPPRDDDDHIHSLYEALVRGTPPWPSMSDCHIFLGSTTLAGAVVTQQRMIRWDSLDEAAHMLVEADIHEASSCAAPVMRGGRIAGVFIVSSAQPCFFDDPTACRAINDLAHLLAMALPDTDFYPYTKLKLRPMLSLNKQREILADGYVQRLLEYARERRVSRAEAEPYVLRDLEKQFEQD